jgi:hypothetical protein
MVEVNAMSMFLLHLDNLILILFTLKKIVSASDVQQDAPYRGEVLTIHTKTVLKVPKTLEH